MELRFVNVSIVLVGQDYAPGVFTHDFLRSKKIIKKGWELAEPPIVGLTGSLLRYSNAIGIAVNQNRIQIVDGNPPKILNESEIKGVATRLLSELPFARNIAVGVNCVGFIEQGNALEVLHDKFIKDGVWISDDLKELSVGFVYQHDSTTLNISYSVGTAQLVGDTEERKGIGIVANYHSPIDVVSLDATAREAKRQINRLDEHQNDVYKRISEIFNLEGANDA